LEVQFNGTGSGPVLTWILPDSTRYQHDLLADLSVKDFGRYRSNMSEDGSSASLTIRNSNFEDAGEYSCKRHFKNFGRSSKDKYINLQLKGKPTLQMENTDSVENEIINATCCVTISSCIIEGTDTIYWSLNAGLSLPILEEEKTRATQGNICNVCSAITFR
ncbi:hypothetical protein, partial [Salmonella sp. s54395]|uniref:hypothetical protein n=1 Tax=Salmonella sp. s54395 TaxID=3159664 RepID=UPI003980B9B7